MQISIRFIEDNDLGRIAQLANNRDIALMTARLPYPYTRSDAQTWYDYVMRTESEHVFAICLGKELVGVIGLVHEADHKRAELGYWLGADYWNKGCASAAAEILLGYAFTTLGVNKVYAHCFAVNKASSKVLEKTGFVLEGCQRQHYIRMGHVHDLLCYGLFKENYNRRSNNSL